MKKNRNNTIKTSKSALTSQIQDITERLDTLEINHRRESDQLREEIAYIQQNIEDLSDNKGYTTAAENIQVEKNKTGVKPQRQRKVQESCKTSERRDPFPLEPLPRNSPREHIVRGNIVQITNSYKGKYSVVGKVTRTEDYWIWLEDQRGERHQRAWFNVQLVPCPNEYGYQKTNREFCWDGSGRIKI